jgi:hypothetical protein
LRTKGGVNFREKLSANCHAKFVLFLLIRHLLSAPENRVSPLAAGQPPGLDKTLPNFFAASSMDKNSMLLWQQNS